MSHGRPNCHYGEVRNGAAARALGGCFRRLIWWNVILSLLNKVCINSSAIARHGGGVING